MQSAKQAHGTLLITGGAGFIGANCIQYFMRESQYSIVNLDSLTYCADAQRLAEFESDPRYRFVHGDICDEALVSDLLRRYRPIAVLNFAAETHVDRSIADPGVFIRTNVMGVQSLLNCALAHFHSLEAEEREAFRFLQVSTDEVFGSLETDEPAFTEEHVYDPASPYSASKAAADHLTRAYHRTYGLPVLLTNCSNNYGPMQYPEKLIPRMIQNALAEEPLPIYGNGQNIRDWLHVQDHCRALKLVLEHGVVGRSYNVGGGCEKTNVEIVHLICELLDRQRPRKSGASYSELIRFVQDRPGHDFRYAINNGRIRSELGWSPEHDFATGLEDTVAWFVERSHATDPASFVV